MAGWLSVPAVILWSVAFSFHTCFGAQSHFHCRLNCWRHFYSFIYYNESRVIQIMTTHSSFRRQTGLNFIFLICNFTFAVILCFMFLMLFYNFLFFSFFFSETLRNYFSQYGEVVDCVIMKDKTTNQSRGFGFVKFKDPNCVRTVLETKPHNLDGRNVSILIQKDQIVVKSTWAICLRFCVWAVGGKKPSILYFLISCG